jgi:predicted nucleic acid-binding protein
LHTVADSGPLISCARANKLALVRSVYSNLIIPPAVYTEIVIDGAEKPGAEEIETAVSIWVEIIEPENDNLVASLMQRIGPGESEAIALAKELDAYLLIDEAGGINVAREYGIRITSTLLMLLEARKPGLISSVTVELNELMASGFRCSDILYRKVLKLSGEL